MTDEPTLTPAEYLTYLEMDDGYRHILVEGRDDRRLFDLLLRWLCQTHKAQRICVDTAHRFIECAPGTRDTIEAICQALDDTNCGDRLVGFVDREFRGFDRDPLLCDRVSGHQVLGRLVWSRGHSIENYLFDIDALCDPMVAFSPDGFSQALAIFKEVFDSAMRMACAISLAAADVGKLRRVRASIDASIVEIDPPEVRVKSDAWKTNLEGNLEQEEIRNLRSRFELLCDVVMEASIDPVRWMCDGHVGFRVIWAVYDRCVELSGHKGALKPKRPIPFNVCANSWVRRVAAGKCEYPAEVFALLGLGPPGV